MPTKAPIKLKPLTSWSFSRWKDYVDCPAKFAYKHLAGLKEPGSPAMDRGSNIHEMAEQYAKGALPKLPLELSLFKEEFKQLKAQKVKLIEDSWTWTKGWAGETTFNDWNNAWVRIKIDAVYTNVKHNAVVIIDHKTGKMRDDKQADYMQQLELYGLAGLYKFPDAAVVTPRLWYLDAGVIYPDESSEQPAIEYTPDDLPKLRKLWDMRIKPMFADKKYMPTPGHACTYCHYRAANNGPCKY